MCRLVYFGSTNSSFCSARFMLEISSGGEAKIFEKLATRYHSALAIVKPRTLSHTRLPIGVSTGQPPAGGLWWPYLLFVLARARGLGMSGGLALSSLRSPLSWLTVSENCETSWNCR